MTLPSKWARMDWPLLLNALALCVIGLLNVYSGTRVHGVPGAALRNISRSSKKPGYVLFTHSASLITMPSIFVAAIAKLIAMR